MHVHLRKILAVIGVSVFVGAPVAAVVGFTASAVGGCVGGKPDPKTILQVAGVTCDELTKQPEPEWIVLACKAIEAGSTVAPVFLVRVPRASYAREGMACVTHTTVTTTTTAASATPSPSAKP